MKVIEENLEDMHKVVEYLLEKETITGGEMVAIIEGRDPALVEGPYTSTRKVGGFRPSQAEIIEAPAKHIHMVSEPVVAPSLEELEEKAEETEQTEEPAQETPTEEKPENSEEN